MSIIRSREIRELSPEDLDKKLEELKTDLFKERSTMAIQGAPENAGRVRELRRTIARLLTIKEEMKKNSEVK